MLIILATNNPNKVQELKNLLRSEKEFPREEEFPRVVSLSDLGLVFVPAETGSSFEANAKQKATETAAFLRAQNRDGFIVVENDFIVVADDSGLEIDALGGEPGVDSANFMGRETPYAIRNAKIIERLADVPDDRRTARFVCVIAVVFADGKSFHVRGEVNGVIAREQKGENGFGYDPIFFLPEYNKTTAELSEDEKNAISHRGIALRAAARSLFAART
jgi:XTP/dITP diphosphohydrolase